MAEELDDGEFWLPTQFLTEDDVLEDFTPNRSDRDASSGTGSDRVAESDEDELFSVLTHQFVRSSIGVCNVHSSKGWLLSTSPKSTLCGCAGKEGSSLGSPSRPLSPPLAAAADRTWDLLNKAAGEVEKVKTRRENYKATTNSGTGFFDCSVNPPSRNLPPPPPPQNNNFNHPSFFSHPQFHQGLVWGQVQAANAPLRLPPSAWPPLRAQSHHQRQQGLNHQHRPMAPVFMGQPELKRGTGVFLPRQAPAPTDTRKKSDGNEKKTQKGKGQSKQRKGSRSSVANRSEIKLPKEWTY